MALSAPLFYQTVVLVLDLVVGLIAFGLTVVSFGHCLIQRADAFTAIGTLPKPGWLALLGGTALLGLVHIVYSLPFGLLVQMIGAAAGLIYLLDVRAGLRGLTDGRGGW
ncbi:hypothetical protein GCM10010124_23070 [Pilimelia terevasa]|uniref:DUF2516 family protein n=1 Tax=Pilimelia terevasa TaxID=53372 RepID=A0A8J3BMG0_9ACTN|nr:DUF2516 family protein [Pilimelia terevasa]GGK29728.1 hypothetical protein GCM10010124_23070 [Pilimelia terevasa]